MEKTMAMICLLFVAIGCAANTGDKIIDDNNKGVNDNKICTMEYAPVCGADGKTYGNKCGADAAGVVIKSQGECAQAENNIGGAQLANPASVYCEKLGGELQIKNDENGGQYGVCTIFGTECEEWKLFRGECPTEQIPCTKEYMPVCGADEKTYGNRCEIFNAHVLMDSEGECK